jgi:hypothetical protein
MDLGSFLDSFSSKNGNGSVSLATPSPVVPESNHVKVVGNASNSEAKRSSIVGELPRGSFVGGLPRGSISGSAPSSGIAILLSDEVDETKFRVLLAQGDY